MPTTPTTPDILDDGQELRDMRGPAPEKPPAPKRTARRRVETVTVYDSSPTNSAEPPGDPARTEAAALLNRVLNNPSYSWSHTRRLLRQAMTLLGLPIEAQPRRPRRGPERADFRYLEPPENMAVDLAADIARLTLGRSTPTLSRAMRQQANSLAQALANYPVDADMPPDEAQALQEEARRQARRGRAPRQARNPYENISEADLAAIDARIVNVLERQRTRQRTRQRYTP